MRTIVYVEGPSDKAAMTELLAPLITQKQQNGITIEFFETPEGDRKRSVLLKVPERAVRILQNDATATVVAMPDLYPRDKGFPHQTAQELCDGVKEQFEQARRRADADARLTYRFHVFCFKYELEALILAAEEALASRLGIPEVDRQWRIPVEDQNHDHPPKQIVEALFRQQDDKYIETVDAPLILGSADYLVIAERCPQQFKRFVEFLKGV